MEKVKEKNNSHWIIGGIIGGVITISALAADFYIQFQYKPLISTAQLLYNAVTVIVGIWITCYLLFLELHKDRYPMDMIKPAYMRHMRNNFFILIFNIVLGCLLALIEYPICSCVWFSVVSLFSICIVLYDVYQSNKTLMVKTYVNDVFDGLSKKFNINNEDINIDTLTDALKQIKYIFEESISKEEYYTARNIVVKTGEMFRDFLENIIKITENTGVKETESAFDKIVSFNIEQLASCKNIEADFLIEALISEQKENLYFCIDHKEYEWFKAYFSAYDVFLFQMHKEENVHLTDLLYEIYPKLIMKLIKLKRREWIEHVIEELESLTATYIFAYNKYNVRNYVMLLTGLLIKCLEDKNEEYYDLVFSKLEPFTCRKYIESGEFNNLKVYYSVLFAKLVEKDIDRAYDFFNIIYKCRVKSSQDSALLEFKLFCISEITENKKVQQPTLDTIFDQHINILMEVIDLNKDYDGFLLLPNFYNRVKNPTCSSDTIDNTITAIKKLINYCFVKDNLPVYYTLLNEIGKSLALTVQSQKLLQEKLLLIYYWTFVKSSNVMNQQYFEVVFDQFKATIIQMDKNNAISSDLAKTIMTNVANCAQTENFAEHKVTNYCILFLYGLLDKEDPCKFVATKPEQKRLLFRCLFNIGTFSIENNYEEGLRNVSNAMGWLIIDSIEQTTNDLTVYLIERANELLYLSKQLQVSQKTHMFLLTLFTTIGAYCCKEQKYKRYLTYINKGIKDEAIEDIKVAASLRTSENDMWNKLFDNRTAELTETFVKQIKSKEKK